MSHVGWADQGTEEIAPGVYRIPLALPRDALRAVNVYALVDDDGRLVMVDAGWAVPGSLELLTGALSRLGFGLRDIKRFLVTHIHRDHYTQAVAIRRQFGSEIALGAEERPSLETLLAAREHGREVSSSSGRLARAGAFELREQVDRLAADQPVDRNFELPDLWLEPPQVIAVGRRRLQVVSTPGHTRGHVVFADLSAGLLFAGDHVLPRITPSLGLEASQRTPPLVNYLESLTLVRAMPDLVLLPAHGPAGGSVHGRIDELLAHHAERLDQSAAAVSRGARTALEVAHELRWTRHRRQLADLDLTNQMLAVSETLAHMEVLVAQGKLGFETLADGTESFSAVPVHPAAQPR
jgi:glyoxylase-like metal-dependent hydrolase (beta-lactamase superfamily II)